MLSQTVSATNTANTVTTFNQSYTYDLMNRIKTALETNGGLGCSQVYDYDNYGNRTLTSSSMGFSIWAAPGYSGTTNRVTGSGWGHSNSGNLTTVPFGSMTYDGEGRMKTYVSTSLGVNSQYQYDAEGRRVRSTVGGNAVTYVYDAFGELAAEYGGTAEAGTRYVVTDHLGSTLARRFKVTTPCSLFQRARQRKVLFQMGGIRSTEFRAQEVCVTQGPVQQQSVQFGGVAALTGHGAVQAS
ncbi:MAG: hypothetical protein HY820_29535 [Acidobacteria bacterium]|nr:hypothetical protein [Acidobacteriota bacterium]